MSKTSKVIEKSTVPAGYALISGCDDDDDDAFIGLWYGLYNFMI